MPERFTRRAAVKSGVLGLGILAGSVVASREYATREHSPLYPLTEAKVRELDDTADAIASHIKSSPFLLQRSDGSRLTATFNPETLAKAITYMAYREGNDQEVHAAAKFLTQHGLHIHELYTGFEIHAETLGGETYIVFGDEPVDIGISYDTVWYYTIGKDTNQEVVFYHELYHALQEARNQDATLELVCMENCVAYSVPAIAGIAAGVMSASQVNKKLPERLMSRRKVLSRSAGVTAGIMVSAGSLYGSISYSEKHSPLEAQAYTQTSFTGSEPHVLKDPFFKNLTGKFMTLTADVSDVLKQAI